MEKVRNDIISWKLNEHMKAGLHINDRLIKEVKRGDLYKIELNDEDSFLSLVWQSNNDCRPLAPEGKPRTLRNCAERLNQYDWSFSKLVDKGFQWFDTCVKIDNNFDLSKFNNIYVTLLNDNEGEKSQSGSFYIFDGVHKSIVLAKRLIKGQTKYQKIDAILLIPRRD